jgi:predicted transcriptional regulator
MTGKVDLTAAFLELALTESPTQSIQERLNISSADFSKHLQILESKALISVSPPDKVKITKRGMQFLELYNSIRARYLSLPA